jgi:hypothetical protein
MKSIIKPRLPQTLKLLKSAIYLFAIFIFSGCDNMEDQPRYEPLEASNFFKDGQSARPLIAGTVPRDHLRIDEHLYTGKSKGNFVETFPFPITQKILERGQERYNIYCTVCHDQAGNGNGMIVKRGFRPPSSFHIDRLREAPVGQLFDSVTNGFATMSGYAIEISTEDRWAIIAYLRALQLSQHAQLSDLSEEERQKLEKEK